MAIVHIVTEKERKAEARSEMRLVCRGLSEAEFGELLHVMKDQFGFKTVLRNPFPPQFDATTVHEIIAHVTGSDIGGYALKQVAEAAKQLLVAYLIYRFTRKPPDDNQKRHVELFDANGKLYEFKDKRKKSKKKN
jgi:hypothetical protein